MREAVQIRWGSPDRMRRFGAGGRANEQRKEKNGKIFRHADGGRADEGGPSVVHELRRLHGRLSGCRVLQLRSPSDREHRADTRRRRHRGASEERYDLVLRRVHVVPSALSARQHAGLCDSGAADPFAEAGVLRRERKGPSAAGAQAYHRREHPPHGLLHRPAARQTRTAPRTGNRVAVDLR